MKTRGNAGACSRRGLLAGSAALLAGGLAAPLAGARAAPEPAAAPPLPWRWVKLDPLEAGRRAYRGYFEHGG